MKILVVDDNYKIHKSLKLFFSQHKFEYLAAANGREALAYIKGKNPDAVLLDLSLGEESGLDVLSRIIELTPYTPVIMITGYATLESAIQAIKIGAIDFLEKPLDFDNLLCILKNALSSSSEEGVAQEDAVVLEDSPITFTMDQNMKEILKTAKNLAVSNIPILIYGESGTGKELLADYIHNCSLRKNRQIVKVNCSAISDGLLDNELFGHEKGAYTGAISKQIGVFEEACGGSLHLDEVGDMSLPTQAKILRAIQYGEIRRVGGQGTIRVNLRFIASTNKNLEELIGKGLFREDLLYRLNAANIVLPPLRDRRCDIQQLAENFVKEFTQGVSPKVLTSSALKVLSEYDWPGNIRELRNIIEVSVALTKSDKITENDIKFRESIPCNELTGGTNYCLELAEKKALLDALKKTNMNRTKAAKLLGISRKTLYNKLIKYGI